MTRAIVDTERPENGFIGTYLDTYLQSTEDGPL